MSNPYPSQFQPYQPAPPPRQSHTVRNVLLILLALFLLAMGGCAAVIYVTADKIKDEADKQATVVFKVTGTSRTATLSYSDPASPPDPDRPVTLPWTKSIQVSALLVGVDITATNGPAEKGSVTCTILVDNLEVSTDTASGPAGVAFCAHLG